MLKVMKSMCLQPRLFYPAILSFKIESKIKSFPEKKKLKEFHYHQLSIARYFKGPGRRRRRKRKRKRRRRREEIKRERNKGIHNKIMINKHLLLIIINVNG